MHSRWPRGKTADERKQVAALRHDEGSKNHYGWTSVTWLGDGVGLRLALGEAGMRSFPRISIWSQFWFGCWIGGWCYGGYSTNDSVSRACDAWQETSEHVLTRSR